MTQSLVTFTLTLPITIRPIEAGDLFKLEWFGAYLHFRNLFQHSYDERKDGRREMLVADCNGYPIGRLFILFTSRNHAIADGQRRAYLYSFAVMEMFRGGGIGSRLIESAEDLLIERQFLYATIAVAKNNADALRLYERYGYKIFDEENSDWDYLDHQGVRRRVREPCWLLEKQLETKKQ
jgi:ribosomal protein S18 acetylase RimI-like enzyme